MSQLAALQDELELLRSSFAGVPKFVTCYAEQRERYELPLAADGDKAWLAEYLRPYFAVPSTDDGSVHRIRVAGSTALQCLDVADLQAAQAVATLDASRRRTVIKLATAGWETFLQLHHGRAELAVAVGSDMIVLLLPPDVLAEQRQWPVRALRCLAIVHALNRGQVLLHGAGVVGDGAAVLVGQKRAGKSTTALSALSAGFDFLTNDQALFCPATDRVRGLPIGVGVRPESLALFSRLEERALSGRLAHYYQTARTYGGDYAAEPEPSADERVTFLPSELSDAFGVRLRACAPLRAVFVIAFERGRKALDVDRLSTEQAIEALAANTFATVSEKQPVWDALVTQPQPNRRTLQILAERVPCAVLRFGERDTARAIDEIRRAAGGSSR